MDDELRKTAIAPVGDVPWGTHFCQFYHSKDDLLDTLVPYFKAGLEQNEFCMWVTSEPVNKGAARKAISKEILDFDRYLESGQIEILSYTDWYLKSGYFDSQRVLDGWVEKLNYALSRGFNGLRLTGNTLWLERKDWDDFVEYEAAVNNTIGKYSILALCTYNLDRCTARDVMDVISNHQFALVKQAGKWQMLENSSYIVAKQALIASEERFRLASEASHTVIYEIDVDSGQVVSLNHLERFLGYKPDEIILNRKWWYKIIHPQDISSVRKKIAAAMSSSDNYTLQYRVRHKNGHYIYIKDNARLIRNNEGKATRIIGSMMDITERKRIETIKDDFIGMVSHEFQTPLTVISGCLNTVLTEKKRLPPEDVEQLLNDASIETDMLSHLLGNLLDMSKYNAGKLILNIENISIKTIINRLVKKFGQRYDKHRFTVKMAVEDYKVRADSLRIERILYNLLENAVKYSPDGGTIKVATQLQDDFLVVSVADKGIGISKNSQKKLFSAFSHLTSKDMITRGMGMDLLLCKNLVEIQGGHIWLKSRLNYGSTFYFSLPLSSGGIAPN
jgi:PAS domain S-box-containing protein